MPAGPVSTDQFDNTFASVLEEMTATHRQKRRAYTNGRSPLANYEAAAVMGNVHLVTSMSQRIAEKVARLQTLNRQLNIGPLQGIAPHEVPGELKRDLMEELRDIANIAALAQAALLGGLLSLETRQAEVADTVARITGHAVDQLVAKSSL